LGNLVPIGKEHPIPQNVPWVYILEQKSRNKLHALTLNRES
jgi:hypothetical protein